MTYKPEIQRIGKAIYECKEAVKDAELLDNDDNHNLIYHKIKGLLDTVNILKEELK